MKVLILSFYYTPDLSAGSFRTTALVQALAKRLSAQDEIHVVTTLPNRYESFDLDASQSEHKGNITITRIALPSHKSGMVDQARAFMVFARSALRLTSRHHYDVVYATSSRLMTAVLGSRVARRQRAPLYLDLRDIFAENVRELFPARLGLLLAPVFSILERYAIHAASKVNLVSEGFAPYFRARYPGRSYSFFTNGVDDEFVTLAERDKSASSGQAQSPISALYAGNIGEGQGLHDILPELGRLLSGRVEFTVIGDGGRRIALERRLAAAGVTNVRVVPPTQRAALIDRYDSADVLFLHLNDYEAFKKVLPSKIFEYAATGKPIWAGVGGYAADFLRQHVDNAVVFTPCDASAAVRALEQLDLTPRSRIAFVRKFSRRSIMDRLASDVLTIAAAHA